jgi:hypothetical protein
MLCTTTTSTKFSPAQPYAARRRMEAQHHEMNSPSWACVSLLSAHRLAAGSYPHTACWWLCVMSLLSQHQKLQCTYVENSFLPNLQHKQQGNKRTPHSSQCIQQPHSPQALCVQQLAAHSFTCRPDRQTQVPMHQLHLFLSPRRGKAFHTSNRSATLKGHPPC